MNFDKNIMNDKEKLIKYLEYKGLNKSSFCSKAGLSSGFLDKRSSLGVDKLRIISKSFPDLNVLWFFDEDAPMIKDSSNNLSEVNEPRPDYGSKNKDSSLMDFLFEKDKELRNSYEEIGRLKEVVRRFSKSNKDTEDAPI